MTLQQATFHVLQQLRGIYPESEAGTITDWVMEHLTGSKKTERMLYKNEAITATEEKRLEEIVSRLVNEEPVQYVLGEAWFCGLRFQVDKQVLIPRPETEELVEWIISSCKFPLQQLRILDIGTGSGCIAVSLKRRLRKAEVWAADISTGALDTAKKNAEKLGTPLQLLQMDFLDPAQWERLPAFDIIVSNPPYVREKDKDTMHPNVLRYEPYTALFVPDEDPLVFYRALAAFGKEHLQPGGAVFCEIHEELGIPAVSLFEQNGYTVSLKKDMQGKDRMLQVRVPGTPAT